MSEEIFKSELGLFKKVNFQGSIEGTSLIQYRPITTLTPTSAIQFDIPISLDEYLDFQNVYLWIKGRMVQNDGTDFPQEQNDRYSLINYPLNTMFEQLNVELNGTTITHSSNTYHYLAYIEALTRYSAKEIVTYKRSAGMIRYTRQDAYNFDA